MVLLHNTVIRGKSSISVIRGITNYLFNIWYHHIITKYVIPGITTILKNGNTTY